MPSDRKPIFVEPSAAGPTQKMVQHKDGTTHIIPGKAHEAREGAVSNPGVRTLGSAKSGPLCPSCRRSGTLRMHPDKPVGQRIYCSSPECGYDQAKRNQGLDEKPRSTTKGSSSGVTILSQHRP